MSEIEACYALRGRARAIVLREAATCVVVPLCDPAGRECNARRGDVVIDRDDLPVLLASQRPVIARCDRAAPPVPHDAWRRVGDVPATLLQRLLGEMSRAAATRAVEASYARAPTERAVRM